MKKYTKKSSIGAWLKKGEDFKTGELLEILNEGAEVDSQFGGSQTAFMARTAKGKEGNVGFNQTSINNMIDAYGEDAEKWIGQMVKVWIFPDFKDGKMTQKLIITHKDAELTAKGFVLPKGTEMATPATKKKVMKKETKSEEIPIIEEGEEEESDEIDVEKIPFN